MTIRGQITQAGSGRDRAAETQVVRQGSLLPDGQQGSGGGSNELEAPAYLG